MRSQLAADRSRLPHKALVGRKLAHDLAQRMAMHIESLVPQGRAQCLTVACGDMLAEEIHERVPRTVWRCIESWDGTTIPHADQEFDVAVVCELLHDAPDNAARLLAEASRVARHVLVKDHFEQDSRAMLRVKALVGARNLTREAFVRLVGEQGLVMTGLDCGLSRRERRPAERAMQKPDFIAVLSRA